MTKTGRRYPGAPTGSGKFAHQISPRYTTNSHPARTEVASSPTWVLAQKTLQSKLRSVCSGFDDDRASADSLAALL